jgi:hypothetical protein
MPGAVAIIISNYNMPERADELADWFGSTTRWPHDLLVVDNGSDKVPPPARANLVWRHNVGPAGVWRVATTYAERMARKRGAPHLGYLLCSTSTAIPERQRGRDLITPLAELLESDANAVLAHPAYTADTESYFRHMVDGGSGRPRRLGFCEMQCGLVRADWFHAIGGYDPDFQLHWGVDVDLCMQAKRQDRGVWLHEGVHVRKEESRGYSSGRYEMSAQERVERALAEMDAILLRKYGRRHGALIAELEGTPRPARSTAAQPRGALGSLRRAAWRLGARLAPR